jgi:hypothetical protein
MRKGYVAVIGFTIGGYEKQVMGLPRRPLGFVGCLALLHDKRAKNPAQDNDREASWLEVEEEDSPGLIGYQRAKLLDFLDLHGSLLV